MKYFFGIDGGGTKTLCHISDEFGQVIGEGLGGRANYQTCGVDTTQSSITEAITNALENAQLVLQDLTFGVLGLSGADEASDFVVLNELCLKIFGRVPYKIMNDTWIGLRTGAEFGVVSICGTGSSHAGVNKDNEQAILRNIDYETGNRGGGSELVSKALHYAFRSNEGTYKKTKIEEEILRLFHVSTMDDVCTIIREDKITDRMLYDIPVKLLELASEHDEVAIEIVCDMGYTQGLFASAILRKLKLTDQKVAMVLIGGLFGTNHPILINSYMEAVHKCAPNAFHVIPTQPPVQGALMLAMEFNDKRR